MTNFRCSEKCAVSSRAFTSSVFDFLDRSACHLLSTCFRLCRPRSSFPEYGLRHTKITPAGERKRSPLHPWCSSEGEFKVEAAARSDFAISAIKKTDGRP